VITYTKNGGTHQCRKTTYHWLLFDVTSYMENEREISEAEYGKIRKSLGL
jgi:hypothetical protein